MTQLTARETVPVGLAKPTKFSIAIAGLALLAMGLRLSLPQGLTSGLIASFVLIPVWVPVLVRAVSLRVLLIIGGIALLSGIWLTSLASSDHATSTGLAVETSMLLLGILLGAGTVVWARTVLGSGVTGLIYGIGMLAGVRPDSDLYGTNPWRFGFSVAVTVIVLAVTQLIRLRFLGLVAVLVLAGLSVVTDARSSFAILLLTAIAVAWQLIPRRSTGRPPIVLVLVLVAGIGYAVFNFGQSLILDGYLGQVTQARSEVQVDASGSLLLGGRPEIAATTALFLSRVFGFGSGTIPTLSDVSTAKTGMAAINYQPNNGYVENYMFGGRIELHSIFGDLWAAYGIPGIVLVLFIAVLLISQTAHGLATRTAGALVVYLAVKTVWSLAFSPLLSSAVILVLVLGLALPVRGLIDRSGIAPIAPRARRGS